MMTVDKVPLSGTPEEIAATLEGQSRGMVPHEYIGGTRLRLLALELAKNTDLQVFVTTYGNESQELEVRLISDSACDPIMVDRNSTGDRCQVSLDHWINIESQPGMEKAARLIAELLRACVNPVPDTSGRTG
jgi:hypothetical protein